MGFRVKDVSSKELEDIREHIGDKRMSKARIKSGRWFLPTELTTDVYDYLKRSGKVSKRSRGGL